MSKTDVCSRVQKQDLNENALAQRFNRFLGTPQYILIIMLLAALSSLFSLELLVYGVFVALAVYILLCGEDLLPIIPMLVSGYVTPSARNNPGRATDSVFFPGHGGNVIIAYAVILVAAVLYRVIRDRKQFFSRKYKFLPGIALLSAAYLLSGIGSDAYPGAIWQNIRFALVQIGTIVAPYFLIAGGVKWENARKDYFAWCGFFLGCLLLVQEGWAYATGNVVIDGIIHRKNFYTGWGMHNNIGGFLAMMIPFAFYLSTKYQRGWIGTLVGAVLFGGVVLTCSRGSILAATLIYFISAVAMLHYTNNRKSNYIVLAGVAGLAVVLCGLFYNQLHQLFSDLLQRGTDSSGRDQIYLEGLRLFRQRPIFGNSFFSPGYRPWEWTTTDFAGFLPARWHSTPIQLLVSCGIVGILAYGIHRVQTLWFFLKNRSNEKIFIALSFLVLVLTSLLDCHFFNIGPVLFYSAGLAFAENIEKSAK